MINHKNELIEKIEEKLTQWDSFIKIRSKSGLYDLHKSSENNIRDILNILYGYKLKNLNTDRPNFPIIDLADAENGLCFQVTANKSNQNYSELESRFLNSNIKLKEKYPKLHVFILSGFIDNRQGLLNALAKTGLSSDRILDFQSVLDKARDLPSEEDFKLDKILQVLDKNYICYKYFDTAIRNYKKSTETRFPTQDTFTSPYLIEEEKNPFKPETENKQEEDPEEFLAKRELGKISFDQACEQSSQFILTGDAGSGKSEVMMYAFKKKRNEQNDFLPFYIDLGKRFEEKDVVSLIHAELNKYIGEQDGISKETLVKALTTQLLANNSLCLLLDGYDEMDKVSLEIWNENIRAFLDLYSGTRLIIAVRRNRIFQDVIVPINKIYSILPFDNEQIEKYISVLLLENGQTCDDARIRFIKTKISQSKLFLTAPTLIIKMLIQYATTQASDFIAVPNTKADAYKKYFEYVILKKLRNSGINDAKATMPDLFDALVGEIFKILSQIALCNFKYQNVKKTKIEFKPLNTILESIENKSKYQYQKGINFFVNELHILKLENEIYYFNHFSYQEFFFAFWLKDRLGRFSKALRWTKSAYLVAKYNQVFIFLAGLMNENELDLFFKRFSKWPFSLWMIALKPLDNISQTKFFFMAGMVTEGNISKENIENFSNRLIDELRPMNELNFEKACLLLSKLSPGSIDILNKIVELVVLNGTWPRKHGLKHYALPDIKRLPEFKNSVFELLNSERSYDRDIAIEIFREAKVFDDTIVAKILELHFLSENGNENEGFRYMTEFSKKFPNKCVDYSTKHLKHLADKNGEHIEPLSLFLRYYFAHIMHVPGYNEGEIENEVLECLTQTNKIPKNQSVIIRAFYKTGIRNETIINTFSRMLDDETPLASSIFMYFSNCFVIKPEIIERACSYLHSQDKEACRRAMNYLSDIHYDSYFERNGKKIRIAEHALEIILEDEDPSNPTYTKENAIKYLTNIKYTENNTHNILIDILRDKNKKQLHSYVVQYLINTKFYSPSFFTLMCNSQGGFMYSWESNQYFENIEKYIPKDKIASVKYNLFEFFVKRTWAVRKFLNSTKNVDDWTTANSLEGVFRIALAFQKIVLYEDEVNRLSKL